MWLIKMAWKNIWRNRNRAIITMSSIFFAVILSVLTTSLQQGAFDNLVKNVVSFYTGYIQVHKAGYWEEQILDNSFEANDKVEQTILKIPNIVGVTPRLESFALVSSQEITKGCMVMGVDPLKEDKITLLKNKIVRGYYLDSGDRSVLLAEGLARQLNLKANDTIVLISQGYHGATAAGKYPVKGIAKFGSPDLNDRLLIMPLGAAQDLFSAYGMVTSYVLSLDNPDELRTAVAAANTALGGGYEVMSWEEIMPDIKQHIATDTNNMKYISGILYMLICFGIFGTLLMMMVERRFEMGMLVAIGMKKSKLLLLFLLETVFTVFIGCFLGILASIPVVYYFNRWPLKFGGSTAEAFARFGFEPIFPTSTDASNFISQGLIVLAIGLLLSLYPTYVIIRLNPISAMKR